jgi:hypothetical protein
VPYYWNHPAVGLPRTSYAEIRAKDIAPSAGLRTRDRPDRVKSGEFRRHTGDLAAPGPQEPLAGLRALAAERSGGETMPKRKPAVPGSYLIAVVRPDLPT